MQIGGSMVDQHGASEMDEVRAVARTQLGALVKQVMQREARAIVRRSRPRTNMALLRHLEAALRRTAHQRTHA